MGLPAITLRPERGSDGVRAIGEYAAGPALLSFLGQIAPIGSRRATDERILRWLPRFIIARWVEHPFEFVTPLHYTVRRDYFWSLLDLFPFREARLGADLIPVSDDITEVRAFAEIVPRNALGGLMTRLVIGPRSCQAVLDQCAVFERHLRGEVPHPFPDLVAETEPERAPPRLPPQVEGVSESGSPGVLAPPTAWDRLADGHVAPDLAERLRDHVLRAPDDEVIKMRPFALADRWATDRHATLVAFLHATTAGLVEMTWDVLCPSCRLSTKSASSLASLGHGSECPFCDVTFEVTNDRQVEVRFTVAPSVRTVSDRRFCVGGPMNLPHIVAQIGVAPNDSAALDVALAPGTYAAVCRKTRKSALIEVSAAAPSDARAIDFTIEEGNVRPLAATVTPGSIRVRINNRDPDPVGFGVDNPGWPEDAATAAIVGTYQEFRDLFGAEILAPGLQLAIQRLTFLFTDLTGSTALYQRIGQARAFRLVQDHFTLLGTAIADHRGAIVKTIGDAIMVAFGSPADAVRGALAMQRAIRALNTDGVVDPRRLLKIGIHAGPCIAVTANEKLDYFGTTINTASRVEHECQGGQIVVTASVREDPEADRAVIESAATIESRRTTLRGLAEPIQIFALTPAD